MEHFKKDCPESQNSGEISWPLLEGVGLVFFVFLEFFYEEFFEVPLILRQPGFLLQ